MHYCFIIIFDHFVQKCGYKVVTLVFHKHSWASVSIYSSGFYNILNEIIDAR